MPAAANVVIADSTPANRTYVPMTTGLKDATWADVTTSATQAGQPTLVMTLRRANGAVPAKVNVRLNIPYEAVVDGVTVVTDTARFSGDFIVPATYPATQRAHLVALVKNLLATSLVSGYVVSGDPSY